MVRELVLVGVVVLLLYVAMAIHRRERCSPPLGSPLISFNDKRVGCSRPHTAGTRRRIYGNGGAGCGGGSSGGGGGC
jgi:hypothetical protein